MSNPLTTAQKDLASLAFQRLMNARDQVHQFTRAAGGLDRRHALREAIAQARLALDVLQTLSEEKRR